MKNKILKSNLTVMIHNSIIDVYYTSVDPLWEKYTGWTGYQYSLNKINDETKIFDMSEYLDFGLFKKLCVIDKINATN